MAQVDSPKLKIRQLDIRTHIHATEDPNKVQTAIYNSFDIDGGEVTSRDVTTDQLTGSFSNPIQVFTIKFTNKDKILKVLAQLRSKLSPDAKKQLYSEFEKRLNEKLKFFFRIEKQELLADEIILANTKDIVQIIISIQNKTPYTPLNIEQIREYLGGFGLIEAR